MRVSICVGNYATVPYCIAGIEISVYCAEELCYCLKENAFLLDISLMEDALVDWISKECGLKELAERLDSLLHKQGSLSIFVATILEYVGFYDSDTVREVKQLLKKSAGLSKIEKRKNQIDFQVQKKKYSLAVWEYDKLLEMWQKIEAEGSELPSWKIKADIFHNRGVAFTGMMLYEQAAESFYQAYQITQEGNYYYAFLAAKRLELEESEYIDFIAGQNQNYEQSLNLEKTMEQLENEFIQQEDYKWIAQRINGRRQESPGESELLIQALKEHYRNCASE